MTSFDHYECGLAGEVFCRTVRNLKALTICTIFCRQPCRHKGLLGPSSGRQTPTPPSHSWDHPRRSPCRPRCLLPAAPTGGDEGAEAPMMKSRRRRCSVCSAGSSLFGWKSPSCLGGGFGQQGVRCESVLAHACWSVVQGTARGF